MTTEFSQFDLHPQLVQAVDELGYTTPTPIQSAIIPIFLTGQDVIGQAQTGTGKTAAFALPMLHNLTPGAACPQALILAPTRELALQVSQAVSEYGRHLTVRVLTVYGGQHYSPQIRALRQGVDVVVGTPGRLLDLIKKNVLDLGGIKTLILDEADEMLSMGFIEDIESILAEIPGEHQTALFSATMPAPIRRLADKYMHQPQTATIEGKQRTVAAIEQRYYLVNEFDKTAVLTRLFEVEEITAALIFTRTRAACGVLANELSNRGFSAEALNSDLNQDARERVLSRFREGKVTVLVATDIAARGLDIEHISHVFNYDLPQFAEAYVHRVGRTGRAGKSGIAISLITPGEKGKLKRIETFTRQKISEAAIPTVEEITAHREAVLLEKMRVWLKRGRAKKERELVEQFAAEGFDPLEIAANALKMARADEKQRPIEPISPLQSRPPREPRPHGSRAPREPGAARPADGRFQSAQSHESGMVRLIFRAGREQGIRPADVVGSIAYHADIPGKTIGAIKIQAGQTFVDVPEQFVSQVLAKSGDYQVRKHAITIELAK
jgi:ATP-dependent RNA helicase DeaD